MPIRVDRSSPVPLYFQVAQHLEQMIESGELPMGTRLENEIDLADQLGLSRPTMRRAIEYLVGRGLLVRKRGIGTRAATAAEARALGERKGAPLLTMERSAYDDHGRAVEHGHHLYRASRYSFDLTLTGW